MVERARVYKGSTELSYKSLSWTKNSEIAVDTAKMTVLPSDRDWETLALSTIT